MFFAPLMTMAGNFDTPPPGSLDPATYFVSFTTWISTVVFLTGVINRLPIFEYEGWNKRFLSWAVMVVTGVIAHIFSWGIFDADLIYLIIYLVAGGVGSHLGYALVKAFLQDIGVLPKKK